MNMTFEEWVTEELGMDINTMSENTMDGLFKAYLG